METTKYIPGECAHCGQTTDYALVLARGTALMVLALYNAVKQKGKNRIHIGNEMVVDPKLYGDNYKAMVADGKMTFKMEGNMTTLHRHGLAAQTDVSGEWLLTRKGANFLQGQQVPRVAIIDKRTSTKREYLPEDLTTFAELLKKEVPFWEIPPFEIDELGGFHSVQHSAQPTLV